VTEAIVHGDAVSCSRLGGAMRRESARLLERGHTLARAADELRAWQGGAADGLREQLRHQLRALDDAARALDEAGAALQRYATDLAEAHELARRATQGARAAGLEVVDGRVVEPWGPASSEAAQRRQALIPESQARVDRVTSLVGRSRARLRRSCATLTDAFAGQSRALRDAPPRQG